MGYHEQPVTVDPSKDTLDPEAVPLAQGHDREDAAELAELTDEYKGTEEPETPVTARAPGDHAGEASDGAYPSDGSVDDVLAWVGDDHDRAQEALAQENARPTPRTTLVSKLEQV